MLPFALKANGTFEQRGKSEQKGPAGACNEGAGSQAPAALMGLTSNPGVPEQLIGKSCYKNVVWREIALEVVISAGMLGRGVEGSGTDFSSLEKPFSNLGGSSGHPFFGGEASL